MLLFTSACNQINSLTTLKHLKIDPMPFTFLYKIILKLILKNEFFYFYNKHYLFRITLKSPRSIILFRLITCFWTVYTSTTNLYIT